MTGPYPDQPGAQPGQHGGPAQFPAPSQPQGYPTGQPQFPPPGQPSGYPDGQPSQPHYAGGFAPPQPPPPTVVERGPRPGVVTVAGVLILVQLLVSLISLVLVLANQDEVVDAAVRQAEEQGNTGGADIEGITRAFLIGGGVCGLIVAGALAVFAVLTLRGANWARITAVVLAGLFALFGLGGVIMTALNPTEGVAGWYTASTLILAAVSTLSLGIAAVLLLLPASNEWFRRR